MHIGIVTTWFERGAAYVSRQYQKLFQASGHTVSIYARGGEKYATGDATWDTEDVTWGKHAEIPNPAAIDMQDFFLWIRKKRLDCIVFNEQTWWPPLFWARLLGVKTVAYVDYYTEETVPLFGAYDALLCNTKRHYSVFSWHPQCLYVPWGTDISVFTPRWKSPSEEERVFFHSAGMNPWRKGTDLVLSAFSQLDCTHTNPWKLIIHTQKSLDTLPNVSQLIARLQNEGRLEVFEQDVTAPGLYHLGDVYVYPSRLDGIGLTVAEALACGLPVILPDNPPMNEFLYPSAGTAVPLHRLWSRRDGYYWPQCEVSVRELAHAMQNYVETSDLRAKQEAARACAETHLDWMKNASHVGTWIAHLQSIPFSDAVLSFAYTIFKNEPALFRQLIQRQNLCRA